MCVYGVWNRAGEDMQLDMELVGPWKTMLPGLALVSAFLCMLVRLSVQPLTHSFWLGLILLSPALPPAG